jgi:FimV-like protein
MIALIIKSYALIFLSVGVGCLCLFLIGLYWIFRTSTPSLQNESDLTSIAGDDIISTQLDLARAYIETNNKHLAKKILKLVISQGSKTQKEEARTLLGLI